MCGIIASHKCEWKSDPLKTISHRGPDNSASFNCGSLMMGHTRLSILDVSSAANQPMTSSDSNYVIIYNGEIYNHLEIRSELQDKYSQEFKTTSDTETLLEGWSLEGESFLKRLNGIFAFAIYSKKDDTLTVVRDSFGVKPLYIYQNGDSFAISSEIKSFNKIKSFDSRLDHRGIANYLTFLWSPGEVTMYKSVRKLLPGRVFEFKLSSGLNREYDFDKYSSVYNNKFTNEQDYIDYADEVLTAAVERQMLSDVPIGFFLSGGLDSSLIVAIAKKINPENTLKCFTINTSTIKGREGFIDDLPYARKVAQLLDVDLIEVTPPPVDTSNFEELIFSIDEPQADLAPLNVRAISKEARMHGIKVLLGGTAGDDLFSGYRRHLAIKFEKLVELSPKVLRRLIQRIFSYLPSENPRFRRLKKLVRDWDKSTSKRLLGYFNWLPTNDVLHELIPTLSTDARPYDFGEKILNENLDLSLLKRMLELEQRSFMVDHNLNYTDKMSMREGVEVRVPFLDFEVTNFSKLIPDSLLIKNNETKYILKKVAERYLPKDIIYRSKTGFGLPVRDMIESEFKLHINKYLDSEFLDEQSLFSSSCIQEMLASHHSGKEDFGYTILSLLAIQSWLIQFQWSESEIS